MNNLTAVHPEWLPIVTESLKQVDPAYLARLQQTDWLPGQHAIFNAFSIPLSQTKYILFGESPYPRAESANGYAFWDAAVEQIWSETGLAKPVNRATSLRNIMKMLLLAEGLLKEDELTQPAIAKLNKNNLVQTLPEFFNRLLSEGFLLLNTSLVLSDSPVKNDAKAWRPFMENILRACKTSAPHLTLVLFGQVAAEINKMDAAKPFTQFTAMHPYNLSFITDPNVIDFFKPFKLLTKSGNHVRAD